MSDSNSAFDGDDRKGKDNCQNVSNDNNAVLENVKFNSHKALGVMEGILSKKFFLKKEY